MPKISVIIPAYNRAHMISNAIESLLNQNLDKKFYEIIVVDNNSTDNTKEIVKKYEDLPESNVKYIFAPNQGLHNARHAGARAANSEILVFTDDDVICDKNWLKEILNAYENHNIDCAGGKIIIKWDKNPPKWVLPYESVLGKLDYGKDFKFVKPFQYINGGNFSIKKSKLYELGGFNPDQYGEILLGDGETGLCKKVHLAKMKMAWVPEAIVWHIQKVSKNATLSDMKRRYANNGVCSAYDYFKYNNPSSCKLFLLSVYNYYLFLRCYCISLMVNKVKREYAIRQQLLGAMHKGKSKYIFNLIFDYDLRKLVKKSDWLN